MDNVKWTLETYVAFNEALRNADKELISAKEKAATNALKLARQIQTYKDEKANELREQINAERLIYARKADLDSMQDKFDRTMKPVLEFVAAKGGVEKGTDKTFYYLITLVIVLTSIADILVTIFKQ